MVEGSLEAGVHVERWTGGDPYATDETDPLLQAYTSAMAAAMGREMRLSSEHGATDAKVFAPLGVPIWLHYPAGGGLHTDDEWMDLASASKLLDGLRAFLGAITPD
jgi:succinyl-diaminopimelate desuccinylase